MSFGWAGQILRVDLSNGKSSTEPTDSYTQSFIGGRGISVKMVYDEVDPKLSPFDPANKLFFAPGVLTGTPAPGSGRIKITGIGAGGWLRNSSVGGAVPNEIKWAGYDLIVVQGKSNKPVYVYVNNDSVEFRDASHIWGKDIYETQQILKNELGQAVQVLCIGPGGEKGVAFGSIHSEWSTAGLGGFGGVMGSKNLKAIAVRGTGEIKIARLEEFLKAAEEQRESYAENEVALEDMRIGSGSALPNYWIKYGCGSLGNFEAAPGWDTFSVPLRDEFESKYLVAPYICGSCAITHLNVFEVPGIGRTSLKCTSQHSVTAVLWNNDWKLAFHTMHLINSYGLDVITTTNIIAFLMELYDKGIITAKDTDGIPMRRGDENAIISAIHKLGKQEGFGKLFKDGVGQGARNIGRGAEEYAMEVKGMALEPYGYRANKQFALSTATNTKDIIDGSILAYSWQETDDKAVKEDVEQLALELYGTKEAAFPHSYEAAPLPAVDYERKVCAGDMIGMCKWIAPWFMTAYLDVPAKLFSLATGVEMSKADLLAAGDRVITLERAVNVARGMRRKHDTLPERFFEEPEPSGPYKGERLLKAKFNKMLDDYYALRGYDKDGVPTEETFKKYGLTSEWKVFKKRLPEEEKV